MTYDTCWYCGHFDASVNYAPIGQCASPINLCAKHCKHRDCDDKVCKDFIEHPYRCGKED